MIDTTETYRLAGIDVAVRTDEPSVLAHLSAFYTVVPGRREAQWTIDARRGEPAPGMVLTSYGAGCRSDVAHRRMSIRAPGVRYRGDHPQTLAREVLVAHWERLGYTMLHASAIAGDGRVIIFAGDKRSGKTTLALRAVLEHGYRLISNDHLVIHPRPGGGDGLVCSSLPTLIPVKIGTYLDLEHLMPFPYDLGDTDLDHWRRVPPALRYQHDGGVYLTYQGLGQDNPIALTIGGMGGPNVTVVLPRFVPPGEPAEPLLPLRSAWPELRRHIRTDWVFNRERTQRGLIRMEHRGAVRLRRPPALLRPVRPGTGVPVAARRRPPRRCWTPSESTGPHETDRERDHPDPGPPPPPCARRSSASPRRSFREWRPSSSTTEAKTSGRW